MEYKGKKKLFQTITMLGILEEERERKKKWESPYSALLVKRDL